MCVATTSCPACLRRSPPDPRHPFPSWRTAASKACRRPQGGPPPMKKAALASGLVSLACVLSVAAAAKVTPDMIQTASDIPADWKPPQGPFDYARREVMIPMRDGVKLHTVLL